MQAFVRAVFLPVVAMALTMPATAQTNKPRKPTTSGRAAAPLVLERQGSFFVGGETKTIAATGPGTGGDVTVNQMYVQFQIPPRGDQHVPVVMVHGCCLSSKTWETTPDGRIGWSEYFVRRNRAVYLADQVSRARSGFDAAVFADVKAGRVPPSQLPNVINATHQIAWSVFRFGPTFGQPFPDEQFPIEALDEFNKQVIPDLNALLPTPNPTWTNMAALGVRLHGAVLMGHSESGFFPEQAALIDPSGIKGLISIEMPCPTLTPGADRHHREDSHSGDVRRPLERHAGRRSGKLGGVVRQLQGLRRGRQESRRRRRDDAPAGARHPRQQPYADAGQEQRSAGRPGDRLARQACRREFAVE